jgi:hypothetical protein
MKGLRILLLYPPLAFSTIFLQSCGAPVMSRQILSVTISPASATAQSGQVQFVATGTYNTAPYTVTPLTATWGISGYPQQLGTITQNGLAACSKSSSGTTTVEAWVQLSGPVCNVIDSAGRPACNNVWGSAQLSCP